MSEVWTGALAALIGMLTVFIILGVLAGIVGLLGRWAGTGLRSSRGWAADASVSEEEEKELVALLSAILAHRPGAVPATGIYTLSVNGRERKLRLVELGPGRAVLDLEDERRLEISFESPHREGG